MGFETSMPLRRSFTVAPIDTTQTSRGMAQVHQVIDRGYRELVEELPRPDLLSTCCRGLADALDLNFVALLRRVESGTLECEAYSDETSLWAELVRLPERWDGSVVGNGPASRALRVREPVRMAVDEEGFIPWREAARDDGIVQISAAPLETADGAWVLLFGAADDQDVVSFRADDPGGVAARGCARLIEAGEKLDRQRLLSRAIGEAGNAAFVTDAEGSILWCNAALSLLTGYPVGDIVGHNPRFLSSGRHGVRYYHELWSALRSGRTWRGDTVDRDRSGTAFAASQTITPFVGSDGSAHYVAIYDDRGRRRDDDDTPPPLPDEPHDVGLMDAQAFIQTLDSLLALGRPLRLGLVAARRLVPFEGPRQAALDTFLVDLEARVLDLAGAERAARVATGEFLVLLPEEPDRAQMLVDALQRELTEAYPMTGELPGIDIRVATAHAPVDGDSVPMLLKAARRTVGATPLDSAADRPAPPAD